MRDKTGTIAYHWLYTYHIAGGAPKVYGNNLLHVFNYYSYENFHYVVEFGENGQVLIPVASGARYVLKDMFLALEYLHDESDSWDILWPRQ
ncbi:hypothetical protein FVEN_g12886 [Fusarium venenatum]|nr:hypothetical protein FVEN_g12886 [Fusarium venenatum]